MGSGLHGRSAVQWGLRAGKRCIVRHAIRQAGARKDALKQALGLACALPLVLWELSAQRFGAVR